ncbi:hypothetical protein SERLA73DRAFT_173996 [Serpula lacrymans var. lacrymans S7.3]|uniref:Uncharacterized protein n=2 Tax=Serpula lacrymans var. lacrymans TaxID=341189 RepID=F8PH13_SERL3|nr:uncharacterized protein SERLADRAFT_454997 [Serpula lacrymans var. lacrymans S7.9]EGO04909.1 hypothetical protein SERLA73DRAFT_173996 [Serpula lacrymans var. lacrymans S7.3]EGO30719.1 hypothetical protein SERLADRAFT_454997 [Serpula lacrymans var. lacrymans S7.9]
MSSPLPLDRNNLSSDNLYLNKDEPVNHVGNHSNNSTENNVNYAGDNTTAVQQSEHILLDTSILRGLPINTVRRIEAFANFSDPEILTYSIDKLPPVISWGKTKHKKNWSYYICDIGYPEAALMVLPRHTLT